VHAKLRKMLRQPLHEAPDRGKMFRYFEQSLRKLAPDELQCGAKCPNLEQKPMGGFLPMAQNKVRTAHESHPGRLYASAANPAVLRSNQKCLLEALRKFDKGKGARLDPNSDWNTLLEITK